MDLASASDAPEAQTALDELAMFFGASSYNATVFVTHGHALPAYWLRRIPTGFDSVSDAGEAGRVDPVMQALRTGSKPVIWGRESYRHPTHARLYEEIADHGVCNGIAMALHLTNNRHFMIGFDWGGDSPRTTLPPHDLHMALQTVAVYAEPALHRLALENTARLSRIEQLLAPLTPREVQVLYWVPKGMTDNLVSTLLGISPRTVRKHVDSTVVKLGASNRVEAAVCATRIGLLEEPPPPEFE